MVLGNWIKNLIGRRTAGPSSDAFVLRTDSQNTARILSNATNPDQARKVTIAVQQIEQIWNNDEQRSIIRAMLMINDTYPFLEKMAELEPLSAEWISQWTNAMKIARQGADKLGNEDK